MKRQSFLQSGIGFLGMSLLAPAFMRAKHIDSCTPASSETAGPFPTLIPSNFVRTNIVGTRTGVAFTININVFNTNGCAALPNVIVDIWHCDKDGYYSQYGGIPMQTADFTTQDFLRGRQTTDSAGKVSFTSIFPGWYTSRATHIHVHIYDTSGNSLSITQIAFPEGAGSAVALVNASTANGYTKNLTGYTYNSADNVFSDGTTTQMSTLTGSVSAGYTLNWDAYVNGGTVGVNTLALQQFQIRQNYPNPCTTYSNVPIILTAAAKVQLQILTTDGKIISEENLGNLAMGEHNLPLAVSTLPAAQYIYRVIVSNAQGSFTQAKLFIKT